MPAGPIASPPWAAGSWADEAWEDGSWGPLLAADVLNICNAESFTLMPIRDSLTLMHSRGSYSTMPRRDSQRHCEDES